MRAVAGPSPLATLIGGAEAPAGGSSALGAPGDAAAAAPAGGRAVPFAAMLATQLGMAKAGAAAGPAADPAPDGDPEAGAMHDAAGPAPTAAPNASNALASAFASGVGAAAAGAAPARAGAAEVRRVVRSLDSLTPELRERLGRVVARMQREYGHTVEVAETGRTQARQDYLFSQGRTRSGPVVTWTRDSNHTRGRAVDVTIDGSYGNPAAFALLQQVAHAEGLHTLGARDPGHLELPRDVPGDVATAGVDGDAGNARVVVESLGVRTEMPTAVAGRTPTAGVAVPPPGDTAAVAQVAPVAPVAAVATVAQVAAVAQVAPFAPVQAAAVPSAPDREQARGARARGAEVAHRVGGPAARGATDGPTTPGTAEPTTVRARAGAHADDSSQEHPNRNAGDDFLSGQTASSATLPTSTDAPTPAGIAALSAPAGSAVAAASPGAAAEPAAPSLGAVAAERIARVLDAQQAAAPRTVSHLTLRVERVEGGEDRIRLDLRGRAVDARIDVADLGAADTLAARTPELRAALARHGLTTDDVRVRQASGATAGDRAADLDAPLSAARAGDARAAAADARTAAVPGAPGDHPVAALGAAPAQTGGDGATRDPGTRDPARDHSARDQTSRDPDARDGRRSNDQSSGGRSSGDAERRPGDGRRERRPTPDAFPDPR